MRKKTFLFYKRLVCKVAIGSILLQPFLVSHAIAQEVILETQDTTSVANTVVEVNTTLQNSEVETDVIVVDTQDQDLVLTDNLSEPSQSQPPTPSPTPSATQIPSAPLPAENDPSPTPPQISDDNLAIQNEASVSAQTQSSAVSGENTQTSNGEATMTTGDATAIASGTTLVNTSLINSSLEVAVIGIMDGWNGNIVVDPLSQFGSIYSNIFIENVDTELKASAKAESISGDNLQMASGSAQLATGDAIAIASTNTLVNTTIVGADIFSLIPSNLWLWTGAIYNWESPGSKSPGRAISNMISPNGETCNEGCSENLAINNQAKVETSTTATAVSGENTQIASQSATMQTGNANAGAVNTTIVNTTLIDSRYRLVNLLLFGAWTGNLIFAYPDLAISATAPQEVTEGEDIEYQLTVKNIGYGKSENVKLEGLFYASDQIIDQNNKDWQVLPPQSSVVVLYKIPTSGRANQNIQLVANITTQSIEESDQNNKAQVSTKVIPRAGDTQSGVREEDRETSPTLQLHGNNNINNFVYPGDSVTYDLSTKNIGPRSVKNAVLWQSFYTPSGEKIGDFGGKIGDIEESQLKKLHFEMKLSPDLPQGNYYTLSVVKGLSEKGAEVISNTVKNEIKIKSKIAIKVSEFGEGKVEALTNEQANILGEAIEGKHCRECLSFPWYIAITIGSMAYYLNTWRRQEYEKTIRWGLALPLSAYVGLIMSNPDCTNGLMMLPSAGFMCQFFLVFAYLIYFVVMWRPRSMRRNLNIIQ